MDRKEVNVNPQQRCWGFIIYSHVLFSLTKVFKKLHYLVLHSSKKLPLMSEDKGKITTQMRKGVLEYAILMVI